MQTPKKITKAEPGWNHHLHLEFEDGSMQVVHRGAHEAHNLKPGDLWDGTQKVEPSGDA